MSEGTVPLLCFTEFHVADKTCRALRCSIDSTREFQLNDFNVCYWKFDAQPERYVLAVVVRVPGGRVGFVHAVEKLARNPFLQQNAILLFDRNLTANHLNNCPTTVHIIHSLDDIRHWIRIDPTPAQCEEMRLVLFTDHVPRRMPQPTMDEQIYADQFFEALREGRRIPPPTEGLFMVDREHMLTFDQEDADFLQAQMLSLAQPTPAPRTPEKRKLETSWESKLKKAEPAKPGDPTCIVCTENKATICFVDCNHTIMCDDCVRIMWEKPDVSHVCPMCRSPCHYIARPHFG